MRYSLLRIVAFAAVLTLLVLLEVDLWLAAIIAAIVGFCVAYIFFAGLRDAVALEVQQRRTRSVADADAESEDSRG